MVAQLDVRPRLVQVRRRPAERQVSGAPWREVRRLLVVRDDRLGDLVLTLPAIAALRRTYPQATIGLLVAPELVGLAGEVGGVATALPSSSDRRELRHVVAAFAPDAAVCISRGGRAAIALVREGVRRTVGPGRRVHSPLFARRVTEPRRRGGRHEVEYSLSFAYRAGAEPAEASFPIRLSEAAVATADRWLDESGIDPRFALLHVGSGGSCPVWPASHFVELADALRARGHPVLLTTGLGQGAPLRRTIAARPGPAPPVFDGELMTLAALSRRAALVVASSSTGPLHLAAALGRPTLAVHAPWPTCGPGRWGPYAANGWAIVADSPRAVGWSRTERGQRGTALLAGLTPETVVEPVLALLAGRQPTAGQISPM